MADNRVYAPTKVRLRSATLAGENIFSYVQNIKVYESMCTPYIKAELTIVDNNGVIAGLSESIAGGLAGERVTFAFDSGEDIYERTEQVVMTIDAQPSEQNKRVQIYNIGTIGSSFIDDRKSLVQQSFVLGSTAVRAAETIHNTYLNSDVGASAMSDSLGPIAKETIGSWPVSNTKPFKAIEDLLKRATYAQWAPPTVYFRDADSFIIAPLEQLFAEAGSQAEFKESGTWGINIGDMFDNTHYAIIAATILVEEDDINNQRTNIGHSAAAAIQGNVIQDVANNALALEKFATPTGIASLVGIAGGIGKAGGSPNINTFNSLRNELSQDRSMHKIREEEFLARVKDADKYLVKVPIRGGLKCTVGKGVTNKILAPAGAGEAVVVGGQMLVADIMHDCYFDQRVVMATSTMRAVKISDVI